MTVSTKTPAATSYALLHLKGDLDIVAVPWAKAEVRRRLETDTRHLILDFHDVTFVDSGGVTFLAFVHRAYAARHGRVVLLRVPMRVRRLLGIAGILPWFELCDSLEEAASLIEAAQK